MTLNRQALDTKREYVRLGPAWTSVKGVKRRGDCLDGDGAGAARETETAAGAGAGSG